MSGLNWRRPLALAATLFALGSFTFWLEFKHGPQQEEHEARGKKILPLDKTQVQSIRISNLKGSVTLLCADLAGKNCRPGDNAKWEMKEPSQVKADDNNSNSLVSTLNNLAASELISLKEETPEKRALLLKDYGLDASSLAKDRQIQVDTPDGSTTVYLGQTHPIGEGIFAAVEQVRPGQKPSGKIDENTIYVLPTYIKASFDRDLSYWRDKKILPVATHEVEGFYLSNSKGEIKGERKNGVWTLRSKGDELAGDIEAMDALLAGATYLSAKSFASENKKDSKARAALAGAKKIVTFSLKREKVDAPIVLSLYQKAISKNSQNGSVQYRFLATVSNLDPVFELESYAKERLDKTLQDLRLTKLITSMDRFSAKRLEFSGASLGTKPWVLLNKDSKWTADGSSIDSEKVQNLLDQLASSKIQLFVTKNFPAEHGILQLVLGDDTQAQKRKFIFWRDAGQLGQKLYARDLMSRRKEVFLMDNSLSNVLPWEKARLEAGK